MRGAKGFTLIELMVTLAVASIIAVIAIPNFSGLIQRNKAESQREAIVSALSLARMEAVKRSATVSLAPITAGNWSGGYQVTVGGEVIKTFPALQNATLQSSASSFQFNSRGYLANGGAGGASVLSYLLASDLCQYERDISVNIAGRISTVRRAC